jgi:protein phosphatase 1 regulatory subunit 3A/B/C/D/E
MQFIRIYAQVALENCIAPTDRDQRMTVSGTVRVANIAYDKHVEVRWTVDSWSTDGLGTYRETAGYMPGSSDGGTDRFAFLICPPPAAIESLHRQMQTSSSSASAPRLEFVISYDAGGVTYWDNNDGRNYGVVVSAAGSPVAAGYEPQQQEHQ